MLAFVHANEGGPPCAKLRPHLSFANVASALALFIAVSTGGAYATHLVVNGSDVVDESLTGADVRGKPGTATKPSVNGSLTTHEIAGQPADAANGSPSIQGSLTTWDIADATLRSADVSDNSLTGADIKDQSGVDTCVLSVRVGQLCVRVENAHRTWLNAFLHCANLDLRLPTLAEAMALVRTHDIPNIDEGENFWTDYLNQSPNQVNGVWAVNDAGNFTLLSNPTEVIETVCVTTPTN
jgi:hypothetical protein